MRVVCNSTGCDHNEGGECRAKEMRHIDRRCRTYHESTARELMGTSFRPRCHKSKGKYRGDHGRLVK